MIDVSDSKKIYDKLKILAEERGLTVYSVSVKAGLSKNTLYKWRDCKTSPTVESLDAVCQVLGLDLVNFLLDEGDNLSVLFPEEMDLIHDWRCLTDEQKISLISIVRTFLESNRR